MKTSFEVKHEFDSSMYNCLFNSKNTKTIHVNSKKIREDNSYMPISPFIVFPSMYYPSLFVL